MGNELARFYRGKRVLVTGHTGFKGSWLALWLQGLGARVAGFSLDAHHPAGVFARAGLATMIDHREGDVRDVGRLRDCLAELEPEIVFHLAAQSLVRESYDAPRATFETNVVGSVNVLDVVREVGGVEAVCVVTSDKVYRNREWHHAYRETDELGGLDPYSASKSAAEVVVDAYRHSFFRHTSTALVTARSGNVIGGGDWAADRIVPDAVRALAEGREVGVRNPRGTRPWQHVLDPLCGYLLLTARVAGDRSLEGAWNFGPPAESVITVGELMDRFVARWGDGGWEAVGEETTKHEARLLDLDWRKARRLLGWSPTLGLDAAVDLTVDWYRRYATESVAELCREQIESFVALPGPAATR